MKSTGSLDTVGNREYGQYCGLARAAEVIGQRWTLLILRDLLVAPRRYSELVAGLPGIPTNLLATRLRELEADGLIRREARSGADRAIVYRPTARGSALIPTLDALSLWGAAELRTPRDGEIVTTAALVTGLRVAARSNVGPDPAIAFGCTVRIGEAVVHAVVENGDVLVAPGAHPEPDLQITGGAGFRDFLAGVTDPGAAAADGSIEVQGDPALLHQFVAIFQVPYSNWVPRTVPA
ncbi:winged helix-turn-helix transcriptional regulator [Nocardia sp. NPDC004568]|uniref:winged helix-turn-helix transcriptional regulator n=1 Tax=Nocardia sp. NPDC004568 TaxID=3154551 RepID=UPI00339E46E1